MRNILMTVMMLMVVALMFVNVVTSSSGIKQEIETKGSSAVIQLGNLSP